MSEPKQMVKTITIPVPEELILKDHRIVWCKAFPLGWYYFDDEGNFGYKPKNEMRKPIMWFIEARGRYFLASAKRVLYVDKRMLQPIKQMKKKAGL
jgi:hypothetical protein